MEKSKPHYLLSEIQSEVARRGAAAFTRTALKNGLAMGMSVGQLIDVVRGLSRRVYEVGVSSNIPTFCGCVEVIAQRGHRKRAHPCCCSISALQHNKFALLLHNCYL